jgi:transposase
MAQQHKKGQEKLRRKIMEMVKREPKTLKAASPEPGVSYSQAKRIYRRYLTGGDEALVHGNTGKKSNNKTDGETVKKAVEPYREKYYDFGRPWRRRRFLKGTAFKPAQAHCGGRCWHPGYGNRKRTAASAGAGGRPGHVLGTCPF